LIQPTEYPMANANNKPTTKKPKLVRDSFTIPKAEFMAIEDMKTRAIALGTSVKKSELLRAGLKLLQGLSDSAYKAALAAVPTLKTGRPAAEAPAEEAKTATPRTAARKAAPAKPAAKVAPKVAAKPVAKPAAKPALKPAAKAPARRASVVKAAVAKPSAPAKAARPTAAPKPAAKRVPAPAVVAAQPSSPAVPAPEAPAKV